MISYGDVYLAVPDEKLSRQIAECLPIEEIREFQAPERSGWPGMGWQAPMAMPQRPLRLGRLYWPRGASRWARGHFIATEDQLDRIRQRVYTGDSRGAVPLDLVIQSNDVDTDRRITAPMYMLAPRPLYQFETQGEPLRNLYLLTLVDERYYWWQKSASIEIASGMTWAELYEEIASALGITITAETVGEPYLYPPQDLESRYDYLPLLLDAVAASVGQRIIRTLAGAVKAQASLTAIEKSNTLRTTHEGRVHFGGSFNLDRVSTHADLVPLVPDTVRVVFPQYPAATETDPSDPCQVSCRPTLKTYDSALMDLAITQFTGVLVKRATKTMRSTAIAWEQTPGSGSSSGPGAPIANDTELRALAEELSRDWYRWQLGRMSVLYSGTVPWDEDGLADFVEWSAYPFGGTRPAGKHEMTTYVCRETLNDLAMEVYHKATRPSSSSSGSSGSSSGTTPEQADDEEVWGLTTSRVANYHGTSTYVYGWTRQQLGSDLQWDNWVTGGSTGANVTVENTAVADGISISDEWTVTVEASDCTLCLTIDGTEICLAYNASAAAWESAAGAGVTVTGALVFTFDGDFDAHTVAWTSHRRLCPAPDSLAVDANNAKIWVGRRARMYLSYDGEKVATVTTPDGPFADTIWTITIKDVSGGPYTLYFDGVPIGPLTPYDPETAIQAALDAESAPGTVSSLSIGTSDPVTITYIITATDDSTHTLTIDASELVETKAWVFDGGPDYDNCGQRFAAPETVSGYDAAAARNQVPRVVVTGGEACHVLQTPGEC